MSRAAEPPRECAGLPLDKSELSCSMGHRRRGGGWGSGADGTAEQPKARGVGAHNRPKAREAGRETRSRHDKREGRRGGRSPHQQAADEQPRTADIAPTHDETAPNCTKCLFSVIRAACKRMALNATFSTPLAIGRRRARDEAKAPTSNKAALRVGRIKAARAEVEAAGRGGWRVERPVT